MLEQHPKKNAGLVLNILPDSCLITSSDTGMGKCIHVSNENSLISSAARRRKPGWNQ